LVSISPALWHKAQMPGASAECSKLQVTLSHNCKIQQFYTEHYVYTIWQWKCLNSIAQFILIKIDPRSRRWKEKSLKTSIVN